MIKEIFIELIYKIFFYPYVLEFVLLNNLKALKSELKIKDSLIASNGDGALSFRYPKHEKGFPELILFPDRYTRENYEVINIFFLPLLAVKDAKPIKSIDIEYYLMIFLILFYYILAPITPKDDLLRHLRTWDGEFKDYREFYIMEWSFSFPIYPLWDIIYGLTYKYLGFYSIKLWEIISLAIFLFSFHLLTKNHPAHIRIILLALLIETLVFRILLAKPSNIIGFIVVLLPVIKNSIAKFLLASYIGVSYYLFFIFLLPFIDIKEVRYAFIVSILFWLIWSDFNYFYEIYNFLLYTFYSRKHVNISENITVISSFANVSLAIVIIYWLFNNNSIKSLLRGLYFLALNQIRFLDSFLLILANSIKAPKIPIFYGLIAYLSLIIFLISYNFYVDKELFNKLSFNNTNILAMSMDDMFIIVFSGNNIKIVPSMEIGLTKKELFYMIVNRNINCSILRENNIEFVVEKTLAEVYDCLELVDVYKELRIWRVK